MEYDLTTQVKEFTAIEPAVYAAINVGSEISTKGFESAVVIVNAGVLGTGTADFQLDEADDDGSGSPDTFSAVADADLIGVELDLRLLAATDDGATKRMGYIGKKEWIRLSSIETVGFTSMIFGAVIVLGNPKRVPTT
ncbi:hypothetical protein LCGC14_0615900 [marine sediment metagenome]|uniref:PLAT domain-containing protein n=1 Tax=marine sediment metagenome TaxID=412755 RepID=A0A0F9TSL1_9ZZZZ